MSGCVGLSRSTLEKLRARSLETNESMQRIVEKALAPLLGTTPPSRDRSPLNRERRQISVSRRCYDRVTEAAAERGMTRSAIVEAAVADVGGAP